MIKNLDLTDLMFGLSPDEFTPVDKVLVSANSEKEVPVTELGDLGYHYLNVTNKDSLVTGKFSITII